MRSSLEKGRLLGIFTERDFIKITGSGMSLEDIPIEEVMTPHPITLSVKDNQGIFSILSLLQKYEIRHLPVIDEFGEICGLIAPNTIREILQPPDLLKLKIVANVMTTQVMQNSPTASLLEIVQQMATYWKSCAVITETTTSGDVITLGIITESDIVKLRIGELDFSLTPAQKVMSCPLFPIQTRDSLLLANELMKQHKISRLVVTDEVGRLADIITETTILEAINPLEIYATLEIIYQQAQERNTQLTQVNAELQEKIDQLEEEFQSRTVLLEKQLQEAREAARVASLAKQTFLRNINHEFKTSLHAIFGFSQVLGHSSTLSQKDREDVENIRRAAENLLKLLNCLLELSKNEAEGDSDIESCFELDNLAVNQIYPTEPVTLTPQNLADLPSEWLASLHQATFQGDLEQMLALIKEIPDKQLAKDLAFLANNLRYEEILKLTQP
ncbi:MAG TPA: hypothetical protein DDW51_26755, partial [Cyanobacteria bacterium UBA11367]|nr:hypothetical protein [Cyanobacteria bacterium UBA11367]